MARAASVVLAFLLVALALVAGGATAWAAPRVAVLPVDFEGRVPEVSRISLSERLVEGLAGAGFEVSAGEVLKSALQGGPALETCHAPACYREIAGKLALDFLVIAQVKIKEKNYSLKLELVGGHDGKPAAEEHDDCELCGIQEVGEKLDKLASSLMSHAGAPRSDPARLTVQSDPSGASVTVDGRAAGETPLTLELSPGAHEVAVAAAGHVGARKKITLDPGIRGLVSVDLLPLVHGGGSTWVRSTVPRTLGIVSMIVGAAAVGAGAAVLYFVDHKEVECPPGMLGTCYRNAKLPAGALLGAGGAGLLTGGLLLFVDWGAVAAAPASRAEAHHWMVSARGTF
jgi:hypothetical protein